MMRLPSKNGEARARIKVAARETIAAGAGAFHVSDVTLEAAPQPAGGPHTAKPWLRPAAVVAAVALVSVLLFAPGARSETIALAGVEAGEGASYAYAGVITPLPGNRIGEGWAARFWADRLTYDYETGGVRVEAEAPGGEAALVRQWSGAWGYSNASAGARFRDTSLSPDDFFNRARGARWDLALQLDGRAAVMQHYAILWLATRQIDQESSFVRLGFDRALGATRLGLDVTRGWDRSYGNTQAGLIASWDSGRGWSVGVRAGAQRNDDRRETGAYIGLNLSLALR